MENITPNSNKYKEEQKQAVVERERPKKVVKRPARLKKKSALTDVFIASDVSSVKEYVFMDVLVPAVKNAIADIVTDGISILLFGESKGRRKSSTSNVSYTKYYDRRDSGTSYNNRTRSGYNYQDVTVDSREEGNEVLDQMSGIIETYGMVSVLDLYDLVGITGHYTDNNYGWTNIRNAEIIRGRDGYTIKMPKALPLK